MRSTMLLALILGFSAPVFAQDLGVAIGYRSDSAESDTAGSSIETQSGIQGGVIAKFDLSEVLLFRGGMMYVPRSYGSSTGTTNLGTFKAAYFELPFGVMYKFSDFGGVFGGGALGMNISSECPGGSCTGSEVNKTPLSLQVGGSFKIAPQFGFEFYYEQMMSNFAKGVKSPRAIVIQALIHFE